MNETLILAVLLGLLGFIYWSVGYRLFRVLLSVGYFLLGATLAINIAQELLNVDEITLVVMGAAAVGGIIGALLSFFLWSLWMIFAGGLIGLVLGYGFSLALGLTGLPLAFVTVIVGLVGGLLGYVARKPLVVIATAYTGAAMMTYAIHLAFPDIGLFDPNGEGFTRWLGFLIAFVLGLLGVAWQASRTTSWMDSASLVARGRNS